MLLQSTYFYELLSKAQFVKSVYLHCTITMSLNSLSPNLTLIVVFQFQSFLVITVLKQGHVRFTTPNLVRAKLMKISLFFYPKRKLFKLTSLKWTNQGSCHISTSSMLICLKGLKFTVVNRRSNSLNWVHTHRQITPTIPLR